MTTVLTPKLLLAEQIAKVTKAVLEAVKDAGSGYPIAALRRAYAAMDVPPAMGDAIERKLVADGVVKLSGGHLFFAATRGTWAKLAATRAE
jgi:hypothetical protein